MDANSGVRTDKISKMEILPTFQRQTGLDRAGESGEREAPRVGFGLRLTFGSFVHLWRLLAEAVLHRQGEVRPTHRHPSVGGSPGLAPQPADCPLAPGLPLGRVSPLWPSHGELWG